MCWHLYDSRLTEPGALPGTALLIASGHGPYRAPPTGMRFYSARPSATQDAHRRIVAISAGR